MRDAAVTLRGSKGRSGYPATTPDRPRHDADRRGSEVRCLVAAGTCAGCGPDSVLCGGRRDFGLA
jgi:hypothetical protein